MCGWGPGLTCRDLVEGDCFGGAAAQRHAHALKQLLLGEEVLVPRQDLRKAQGRVRTGGDGHLEHSVTAQVSPPLGLIHHLNTIPPLTAAQRHGARLPDGKNPQEEPGYRGRAHALLASLV